MYRLAEQAVSSVSRPAIGGSICGAARDVGTLAVVILRPNQHARAHYRQTGHFIMASFEPGEDWFWDYRRAKEFRGPTLAPPHSRPSTQPAPGPEGLVPLDWRDHLRS